MKLLFIKAPPMVAPFIPLLFFFLDTVSFCVFYKFPLKTFQFYNNAPLQGSQTERYHLHRQLETSLITAVLQSKSRLITEPAKRSTLWHVLHYSITLNCLYLSLSYRLRLYLASAYVWNKMFNVYMYDYQQVMSAALELDV